MIIWIETSIMITIVLLITIMVIVMIIIMIILIIKITNYGYKIMIKTLRKNMLCLNSKISLVPY